MERNKVFYFKEKFLKFQTQPNIIGPITRRGKSTMTLNKTKVSEWLLFNANSTIFQLYHGKNKLSFNEMMLSALY
jgi:hypothetical protein